jgi:hypothetical protein
LIGSSHEPFRSQESLKRMQLAHKVNHSTSKGVWNRLTWPSWEAICSLNEAVY